MIRALVLQHISCEPPGVYEEVMRERGVAIQRVEVDEGEALPERGTFDAIVAMGGPMSVNDEERLPWLREEKRLIASSVRDDGVPLFGACLGAQLVAASLGARVVEGPRPEVGLMPVTLTDAALDDPVFGGLPRELLTFQWHGDTFDLPDGAIRLASSPLYPNQAFRWGLSYGVQFHLEVSPALAREWADVPEYAESLERTLGPGALERVLADISTGADDLRRHARHVFENWLDQAFPAVRDGAAAA
jgi:GMP synthase-like glutamine amidotransferase